MEQLVRDARIAQIYEGTNGVQAMDLVGRKLPAEGGRYLERYFALIEAFISEHRGDDSLNEFVQPLEMAFERLQEATGWLSRSAAENADEIGAAAYDYMRLTGQITLALLWARMAKTALAKQAESGEVFYRTKLKTARFYMQRLLPQTQSLLTSIQSGATSLMVFDEEEF